MGGLELLVFALSRDGVVSVGWRTVAAVVEIVVGVLAFVGIVAVAVVVVFAAVVVYGFGVVLVAVGSSGALVSVVVVAVLAAVDLRRVGPVVHFVGYNSVRKAQAVSGYFTVNKKKTLNSAYTITIWYKENII